MPKGKKLPDLTKRKISLAQRGKRNSFYGKHHTAATKKKLRALVSGTKNPMYGKHHTEAVKRKISLAARRRRLQRIR